MSTDQIYSSFNLICLIISVSFEAKPEREMKTYL